MHIALTDGERVEYETYAYYQGRDAAKRRFATTVALIAPQVDQRNRMGSERRVAE